MENLSQNNQVDTEQVMPPQGYLVRHNNTIVGIFSSDFDAQDALHGYQMQNDIQLNDVLDIIQIL